METKLKEYREELKRGNLVIAVTCFVLLAFCAFFALNEMGVFHLTPVTGDSHWASMWNGFLCGAACGILGLNLLLLVRNNRALGNPEQLKKLYIQEHDERQIQIWTAARARATQIFLLGGLAAGIIAGYFSMAVGITILACVVAHSLIALGCKVYYSGKF